MRASYEVIGLYAVCYILGCSLLVMYVMQLCATRSGGKRRVLLLGLGSVVVLLIECIDSKGYLGVWDCSSGQIFRYVTSLLSTAALGQLELNLNRSAARLSANPFSIKTSSIVVGTMPTIAYLIALVFQLSTDKAWFLLMTPVGILSALAFYTHHGLSGIKRIKQDIRHASISALNQDISDEIRVSVSDIKILTQKFKPVRQTLLGLSVSIGLISLWQCISVLLFLQGNSQRSLCEFGAYSPWTYLILFLPPLVILSYGWIPLRKTVQFLHQYQFRRKSYSLRKESQNRRKVVLSKIQLENISTSKGVFSPAVGRLTPRPYGRGADSAPHFVCSPSPNPKRKTIGNLSAAGSDIMSGMMCSPNNRPRPWRIGKGLSSMPNIHLNLNNTNVTRRNVIVDLDAKGVSLKVRVNIRPHSSKVLKVRRCSDECGVSPLDNQDGQTPGKGTHNIGCFPKEKKKLQNKVCV
mmetsp:Transcript_22869/g.35903  ORF Transcript_22869/g.35903 Transcript_22869/m.35903 type:complete len:465 (-) Transcript_22869:92-1486(-)